MSKKKKKKKKIKKKDEAINWSKEMYHAKMSLKRNKEMIESSLTSRGTTSNKENRYGKRYKNSRTVWE